MKVPFTILSGWLGAGKTTALNRMLGANHGKRIAVLVNELGRISIDTQLIVGSGGDVLELAGGCVCCKLDLKNDLWEGITEIVERSRPDHVVLETTGIAEPAAILESLHAATARAADSIAAKRAAEQVAARERIAPAGVICVVDAESGAQALAEREEAGAQAMAADRVLLAKLDVATADAVRATHARLDELAPHAERASFPSDAAGALAMTAWLLEPRALRAWSTGPQHDEHGGHHHGNQLIAISFRDAAPMIGERVLAVIEALGASLVRAKGFVYLAGEPRRGFLERAGIRTSLELRETWGAAERATELVLIGDDLDEAAVRRALWACRAGGS
ncbi:MAG: GTP-binding protein [Kofleriaceae bacterium]